MEPTQKHPNIEKLLPHRVESIKMNRCVPPPLGCGKQIQGFRDDKSLREYRISGLCQECQDAFFGKD